jgi:aminomethyltransferase
MGYFHSGFFEIAGQNVYVWRTGWTGELGFEIYTQGVATDCLRLWDHLIDAGTLHGMMFASISSMEIRRIEAGILDNGTDFDLSMTPFEAGLGAFIDLDKGDFIGRAELRRSQRGTRLFGITCSDAVPAYRGEVVDGERVVMSGSKLWETGRASGWPSGIQMALPAVVKSSNCRFTTRTS